MPSGTVTPAGGGGSSAVLTAAVTLTPTQVKATNTAPPTVVAAPGSSKTILPLTSCAIRIYGGTAYTAAADFLDLGWLFSPGNVLDTDFRMNGILTGSGDRLAYGVTGGNTDPLNQFENLPLVAYNLAGDPTVGNSPITITVAYIVVSR